MFTSLNLRQRLSAVFAVAIVIAGLGVLTWAILTGRITFRAATGQHMFLDPATRTVNAGETFTIIVRVNTNTINTVVARSVVKYKHEFLSLKNVTPTGDDLGKTDTKYSYEVENSRAIDGVDKIIRVTRGEPGDGDDNDDDNGFRGSNGQLVKFTFKALKATTGTNIEISLADSSIIADDRNGREEIDTVANSTITITGSAPTVAVELTANPSSGPAPLNDVDLIADVSGTATGNIHYQFDCTNDGSYEHDVTNNIDPYPATDICDYPNSGSYTARVRVEREGVNDEDTTMITVTTPPPPPPPPTPEPTPSPPPTPQPSPSPSPEPEDYRHSFVRQNGYPTLDWSQAYRFELTVRNTGRTTWRKGTVNLATDRARDRIPGFIREGDGPSGWLKENRIEMSQASVAPGQEGTFAFWMRVPRGKTPGTYREYFRLVADGVTWMEDYGIYWDVLVPTLADLYHARWVSQNSYPTLRRGQSYMFEIKFRNTGVKAWERAKVNLGTDRPRDVVWRWLRQGGDPTGWLNNNRIHLVERDVPPGAVGTFRFWYTVPSDKPFGTYRDYFRPVADGVTWLDDCGCYWDVSVVP